MARNVARPDYIYHVPLKGRRQPPIWVFIMAKHIRAVRRPRTIFLVLMWALAFFISICLWKLILSLIY